MWYIFDTETIQFVGDTILIQYEETNNPQIPGDIVLHEIFNSTVGETLSLIENMKKVIAFNLGFDTFHIAQTYNILRTGVEEGVLDPESIPPVEDYYYVKHNYNVFSYCWKPERSIDLMLHGRQNVFQSTMSQAPIVVRRVPKMLAPKLIEFLRQVKVPDIYFAAKPERANDWRIVERDDSEELVDIKLSFHPSTSLKSIAKYILGYTDAEGFSESIPPVEEKGYLPLNPAYKQVAHLHIDKWANDSKQREYAENDILYTRELYNYFFSAPPDDLELDPVNHELAVQVGNCYWSGYSVDRNLAKRYLSDALNKEAENKEKINFNSPKQVKNYLINFADEFDSALIEDTSKPTLKMLKEECEPPLSEEADFILKARSNSKNLNMLEKFVEAGRLHAMFKVVGTKSNRMSGGSIAGKSKGGSINPQGINKKGGIREIVTFTDIGYLLFGGDFSGYEVSIMEAVYNDPELRRELESGRSFHGVWGSIMFSMPYEEVVSNTDLYNLCKIAVFAEAYGADINKLANITGLSVDDVVRAKAEFNRRFPKIKANRDRLEKEYSAMFTGENGKIEWKEPKDYVESILGFRRYFTVQWKIIRFLYGLARDLPEQFKTEFTGLEDKIKRGKRMQTPESAIRSALFSSAFSLQSGVIRAVGNHEIQSPGGQITKGLQAEFWKLQPTGCKKFMIKPFNVHDEIEVSVVPELVPLVDGVRTDYIEKMRKLVPLLAMDWKQGKNWAEVH